MIEYLYWDFEKNPISVERYKEFLHEYYGELAESRYYRLEWYIKRKNFYLLLALYNGEPVGQACTYRVLAQIKGEMCDWWWGVDTFVLAEMRGKGIGKGLQKRLHLDFPSFSSLWYSRANGAIKRSCGAIDFLYAHFNFYPIESFGSILMKIFFLRYFNRTIFIPAIGRNKFYYFNRLFSTLGKYVVKEIDLKDSLSEIIPFVEKSLEKFDFYIPRDCDYLYWKYVDNPTLKEYHAIAVYSSDNAVLLAVVIFSGVFRRKTFSLLMDVATILDVFLVDSRFPKRDLLLLVMKYFKDRKIHIEGILSLQDMGYFPCLRFPHKGMALLSTNKGQVSNSFYLSYSDQDMEQMVL